MTDWAALAQQLGASLAPDVVSRRQIDRHALAHDASHYLLTPEMVVRPTSGGQVASVMRACAQAGAPITFRAAGTSLSGQALSDAVMVDTRRHFEGVEVLDEGKRVRVRPGTVVRAVNARLKPYHRALGPDPASEGACTIGGVIANNSSGMQCGTQANTYATLESMVLVLPTGTQIDTSSTDASAILRSAEPDLFDGLSQLRRRVLDNHDSLSTVRRLFSMKNTMGYGVNALVDFEDPVDILAHLMIGSEGTLGFVAEAVFHTVPVQRHTATGLLVFDDVAAATAAVPDIVATGTATAELLDAASLQVSQADTAVPRVIKELHVRDHAALLLEYQAGSQAELTELIEAGLPRLRELTQHSIELTSDAAERARMWQARKALYSAVAGARPPGTSALLEDIAVPVDVLGQTCVALTELFDKHRYQDSVIFGHAKDGNVHFLLNEHFNTSLRRYADFTDDLVDLVLGNGGTLKAEHGTGRIMAPFVRRQYGDELYEVMKAIKHLIDPDQLLNPGSVLSDEPLSYLADLKPAHTVEEEVDKCVECGYCEPVCPSRDLTLTPRQRIVIRRDIEAARARGDDALADELERDYSYSGVQTCAVDGMCVTVCPVQINTGDLVRRLRRESALPPVAKVWATAARHWSIGARLGSLALTAAASVPSALPTTVTSVGRRIIGDDIVPRYAGGLPPGGRRRPTRQTDSAQAVIFPACVGEMFAAEDSGPSAGEALLQLCDRADVSVRTPEGIHGLCCGTPWKSKGFTEGHDAMASQVVPALREATEGGRLPVVVDASSCTEGLIELLSSDAPEIQVQDALDFVAMSVLPGLTVSRQWSSAVVHPTCSGQRAGSTEALLSLAGAVSEDVMVPHGLGCCAFAGDRGMLHPELTASATRREAAEVRAARADVHLSSNRTCEIGMTRATGQPYRHVLQALAEASR
ncbi:MAG: FAD-binding and (Fe-S)-binding domain-containing protein [Ornithinimicrobium sp.]